MKAMHMLHWNFISLCSRVCLRLKFDPFPMDFDQMWHLVIFSKFQFSTSVEPKLIIYAYITFFSLLVEKAKYDDSDSAIYHPVGALDDNSYRNVNGLSSGSVSASSTSSSRTYFNYDNKQQQQQQHHQQQHLTPHTHTTNPNNLTYIELAPLTQRHKSNSSVNTSLRGPSVSSVSSSNSSSANSDYTRIDSRATEAINQSMSEQREMRHRGDNTRTPTRNVHHR